MDKKKKILTASLIFSHLLMLVLGVFFRFTDGDEGGMLAVAKEVIGGRVPILDINAHNQPLMYYFYGLWMKLFGFSIISGRFLSVFAMFAAGLLLLWWTYKFTKSYATSLIIYFIFIVNLTFFKANITVKPFALTNFFTFASFALLSGKYLSENTFSAPALFFSGVFLGLALGVRLMFILPIVFAIWIVIVMVRDGRAIKDIAKNIFIYSVGVFIPLIPSVVIFLKEPLRAYTIWAGAYSQVYLGKGANPDFKIDVLKDIRVERTMNGLIGALKVPDTAFLIPLVFVSTMIFFYKYGLMDRAKKNVYFLTWAVFGSIIWLCSNLYLAYFAYVNQVVLFALLLIIPGVEALTLKVKPKNIAISMAVFVIIFTALFYSHFQKKLNTSIFYMFASKEQIITPGFVSGVSNDVVKRLTKDGDIVFDTWGVFVFASGRQPVKGFEYPNDSDLFWAFMQNKEMAGKYLYISESELYGMFERKEIPLVILGDDTDLRLLVFGEGGGLLESNDVNRLRRKIEMYYDIYKKYYVKPTNAWVLIYLPKK